MLAELSVLPAEGDELAWLRGVCSESGDSIYLGLTCQQMFYLLSFVATKEAHNKIPGATRAGFFF